MTISNETNNKRLFLNLGAQILAFLVNVGIGFFFTPYIVRTIGSTAYGFVGLANNFINYVSIVKIALNSMAGRFIAIHYYQNDYENVQRYYTSVLFANIFISSLLVIPSILLIVFLDKIVEVPRELFRDVQLLWIFLFGNMLLSMIGNIYNNACYVRNRLELVSFRTIESKILHAVVLIGCFALFIPHLWYIGLASTMANLYSIGMNFYYTNKLMPFVNIKKNYFEFKKIIELIKSGCWNSIAQIGTILTTGLQLLITNLFVGAEAMGVVAVAKTVPIYISSLFITVSSVFAPQLTISYAQNDNKGMIHQIQFAMKLIGLFTAIPIAYFYIFGVDFYNLWMPTQNARLLTYLSLVSIIDYPITLVIRPLFNVFTTANKVRFMSLVTIVISIISCLIVLVMLNFVENDIQKMFIILGVGCILNLIENILILTPYCVNILNSKMHLFLNLIFRSLLSVVLLILLTFINKKVFFVNNWLCLICHGCIVSIIGIIISGFVLLNKREMEIIKEVIKKKIVNCHVN